ncbi:hypothetical protein [Rhodoferax sp.]|uniref:hypothetical protein n=1 Tax=Rhodoferax sp. TaxID=50421 RepID=UPI0026006356|nr:hypothetical protein [Rhodoferax sp.]
MATKPVLTSDLKMVIYGQGSTENRGATLLRMSDRLREELAEVAQGPLYLLIEVAIRRMIDDLKSKPAGQVQIIDAATIVAEPSHGAAPKRATRERKPKEKAAKA